MQKNFNDIKKHEFKDMLKNEYTLPDKNNPLYSELYSKLLEYLKKDMRILDAGCGSGRYSLALIRDGFKKVESFDFIDATKGMLPNFKLCDMNKRWNYPDNTFDAVISLATLYYAEDIHHCIKEIKRILRPNGIVFLTFITRYSLYALDRRLKRILFPKKNKTLRYVNFYSHSYIKKILENNNFEILDLSGYNTLTASTTLLPFLFIKRLFKRTKNNQKGIPETNKINHSMGISSKLLKIDRVLPKELKILFGHHFIVIAKKVGL